LGDAARHAVASGECERVCVFVLGARPAAPQNAVCDGADKGTCGASPARHNGLRVGSREVGMSGGQHDVERCREAAYAALDQLDWATKFFCRIQKSEIADVLEENRRAIIARHGL